MDYRPSQPQRNVNVSDRHPLKEFAQLTAGLAVILAAVWLALGLIVDTVVNHMSDETEQLIHEKFPLSELQKTLDEAEIDAEQTARINTLFNPLLVCSDLSYDISIHVNQSETVNAFAFPGGYLGLNTGLLNAVKTDQGLGFVLAHELAHFHNRDHLRSLGRGVVFLSGVLVISFGNTDISPMLSSGLNLQMAQYSQKRETLADSMALELMTCAFGSTEGAGELFEHLHAMDRKSPMMGHYFSSHPKTEERIKALENYQASP